MSDVTLLFDPKYVWNSKKKNPNVKQIPSTTNPTIKELNVTTQPQSPSGGIGAIPVTSWDPLPPDLARGRVLGDSLPLVPWLPLLFVFCPLIISPCSCWNKIKQNCLKLLNLFSQNRLSDCSSTCTTRLVLSEIIHLIIYVLSNLNSTHCSVS